MNKIEKNDIRLLSHMIYTIYSTEDLRQMRLEFLKLLKYIIPFDTANFFLVNSDPDCNYTLTDPVNVNSLKNPDVDGVLKEYMEHCFEIDSTHWLCNAKKSIAYRSTDFLSEASLENTQYYREMFLPFDLHFGAQAVLAHNDDCVGLLTLFRSKESPNFTDTEIFYLDNLKDHLSKRLYEAKSQSSTAEPAGFDAAFYMNLYNLTRRECEILDFLLQGLTNEQLTEKLCISENTLRRHLYNLYQKLGIRHRWQLHFLDRKKR